jgi:hypothetical protein
MYSLYPNRSTGFFVRVDQRNLALPDVEDFSADADFSPEVSPPCASESDSLRCDSFLYVSESDTFLFPFSLRVNRLLGLLRGEFMVESPLLAGLASDLSNRPSPSLGPLTETEIGLSGRVPISGSSQGISASLTSSSELESASGCIVEGKYQNADSSMLRDKLNIGSMHRLGEPWDRSV